MKKLLLVLLLCLSACASPAAYTVTGRFVELDITPPIENGGQIIHLLAADGTLYAFDEGLQNRYTSHDKGITWLQSAGPGSDTDRFMEVQTAGLLTDGRLLVYLRGEGMTAIAPDGTTQHVPMTEIDAGIAEGEDFNVHLIKVLDDERVLLTYSVDWIARFMREQEPNGNTVTVRGDGGGGMNFGVMEDVTAIHQLSTGRELSRIPHVGEIMPLGANTQGDIYTIAYHNLVRYNANGYADTLLYGTAFAFGAPGGFTTELSSFANGGFIANVTNRLYKYIWDENARIDPNKVLSIWALEDNALVRAAITELWGQNPEADITFEIAPIDDIRALNTRLLSGNAPDIIILDGTPMDSYINRGMLLDLSGLVDINDMYQNLIPDGHLYVIPTQLLIPMIIKTADAQLEDAAFDDLEELFHILWQAKAASFIHDNQLNSHMLEEFLHTIQSIYENIEEQDSIRGGIFVSVSNGRRGRTNIMPGSLTQFIMENTDIAAFEASNIMLLHMFMRRDNSQLALFPTPVQGAWVPSTVVGVSADTQVKDFALTFVNTMLSQEVQKLNHGEGLPVMRGAVAWQIDQINEQMPLMDMPTFDLDFNKFIEQLKTPAPTEATLRELIWQTTERLATEQISLEGAVSEIEQNIRNYLAERS